MALQYLIDENLSSLYHDFVLVTNNRTSIPRHLAAHLSAGHHVPGILVLDPGKNLSGSLAELVLVAGVPLPGEYRDKITYLPVT